MAAKDVVSTLLLIFEDSRSSSDNSDDELPITLGLPCIALALFVLEIVASTRIRNLGPPDYRADALPIEPPRPLVRNLLHFPPHIRDISNLLGNVQKVLPRLGSNIPATCFTQRSSKGNHPVHDANVADSVLGKSSLDQVLNLRPRQKLGNISKERSTKVKVKNYAEEVIPHYTLDDFKRFFRMSRNTFEVICQQLGTFADFVTSPGGRPPVPLDKQLLMFLWHVGCLEPLCRTSDRFNVTEFTVLRVRDRICRVVLNHLVRRYIVWPTGADQGTVIRAFREKRGFPGVIGVIDSSHIQIKAPREHPQTYINRKGYHSIILQAVCREDLRFTDCFAGWPGSCHDSRVIKNSDLWDRGLHLCGPNRLIGDGGFPVRRWLLTPYRDNGHLTAVQRHYNFCLSSTRQVIEQAFSLLKGRFRKLQMIDVNTVPTSVELCITCCCFHNICILENDDLGEYFNNDNENANLPAVPLHENDAEGFVKRNAVAQQLQQML